MSLSGRSQEEIEFASGRADAPASTISENLLVFEATEDRILVAAYVVSTQSDTTVELSFSSNMLIDASPSLDQTSSGIVAMIPGGAPIFQGPWPLDTGPVWHAGEELNLHVDNASGNQALVLAQMAYVPVGEFLRERLRNS